MRDATNVYHNWTASYKHSGVKNVVKACLVCYVFFAHPSCILSIHNFKLICFHYGLLLNLCHDIDIMK